MSAPASNLLVGRRAVYARVERKYDDDAKKVVEVSRQTFHGTIAALITTGEHHYASVVMLWDDGSLSTHDIGTITVEGESAPGGPFR